MDNILLLEKEVIHYKTLYETEKEKRILLENKLKKSTIENEYYLMKCNIL